MRRGWRVLILIVVLIAALPLLRGPLSFVFWGAGDRILRSAGGALWRAGQIVRSLVSPDIPELRRRLAELEVERNALVIENARLRVAREENETLAALLHFSKRTDATLRPASVIAGSTDPDIHAVDIDAGSAQGVAVGDAVATGEGIVVGKVSSVRTETATVELLTDSRSKFAAALLPEEGDPIPGVTEGGYGTGMVLRLIPEYARVQVGDLVFTSGLEAGVPRGLIIGRVESVRQEPHEPFQTATLSPLVPLDTLSIVAVVLAPR